MNPRRARLGRSIGLVVAVLLAVAAAGAMWERLCERCDRSRFPPPGRLVDAGGHRLHLRIEGDSMPGPTVILECGIGGATSCNWGWVEPDVARFARVVAYDRAGLGWSEPGPLPRDGRRLVEELHAALASAGLRGPYVFVGHSYGGLLARLFVDMYPSEVEGLVLAEPSHPTMFQRMPQFRRALSVIGLGIRLAPYAAGIGLIRAALPLIHTDANVLPPADGASQRAFLASPAHWRAVAAEMASWRRDTSPEAAATKGFGDRPLIVLTAGSHGTADWTRLQASTAALSSDHEQRLVPGATHGSLVNDRRYAASITGAVREVVDAVRAGHRLGAPAGTSAARTPSRSRTSSGSP